MPHTAPLKKRPQGRIVGLSLKDRPEYCSHFSTDAYLATGAQRRSPPTSRACAVAELTVSDWLLVHVDYDNEIIMAAT